MDFTLTEEQQALQDTVRRLLARWSDRDAVRAAMSSPEGYDPRLWKMLCEQVGVAGLAVAEEYGGAGASLLETHVLLEELGRALSPVPMLGSAVLATQAILATGNDEACARLLPDLAAGTAIGSLAWADSRGWDRPACQATESGDDWAVTGEAHFVLDGDLADVLLVIARASSGAGLFEVAPEHASREHVTTVDQTRRLATVRLDAAPATRLDDGDYTAGLERLRDIACVALSAEQVGVAAQCLEMTVEYAKQRHQFGRPIGSFQALKHRMADMFVLVEGARSASYAAAWSAVHEPERLPIQAAVARAYCSEAVTAVAGEMIQLHGGIAITWEHDAHLYFKRAHGSAALFGAPTGHVTRLGAAVLP